MADLPSSNPTEPKTGHKDLGMQPGLLALTPVRLKICQQRLTDHRLNFLIPVLSDRLAFGGIATALRFFESLSRTFKHARIVVTYEKASQFESGKWSNWAKTSPTDGSRSIAFVGEGTDPLAVSGTDIFVATFWSTAFYIERVLKYQSTMFPGTHRRFVYFIQDYEPSFYPTSVQHAYAESTYRNNDSTIAVFNSSSLAGFFKLNGFNFYKQYVFEPILNTILLQKKELLKDCKKERIIYVYARPSMPRNGFDLIVEVLRAWARSYASAPDWSIISDGEKHADIPLGGQHLLRSKGKATMDAYADLLARCWVGLAFVFTPGCSYAAYDVAEFGSWVITNKWKNKDPSSNARSIICASENTMEDILDKLIRCCDMYQPGRSAVMDSLGPVYRRAADEFPFVSDLATALLSPSD